MAFEASVYNADTGEQVSVCFGGLVYQLTLPEELLSALREPGVSAVNLYACVSAGAAGPLSPETDAKIQIRQVGLFTLD